MASETSLPSLSIMKWKDVYTMYHVSQLEFSGEGGRSYGDGDDGEIRYYIVYMLLVYFLILCGYKILFARLKKINNFNYYNKTKAFIAKK